MVNSFECFYTCRMKLAKVTTFYGEYLESFYRSRPGLAEETFANQKAALDMDAFGWADYWSHALRPLGYETFEIVGNAVPLQRAWSRENAPNAPKDMKGLVLEQLRRFAPDVLFMAEYASFPLDWLVQVRESCPSIRLIVGWCGAPYSDGTVFKGYDLVLSCIPELVEHFREIGHTSAHLNHAFDPRIIFRLGEPAPARIPFSFVGQIVKINGFHTDREKLLLELSRRVPLEIFSPAANVGHLEDFKSLIKASLFDLGRRTESLGIESEFLGKVPILGKHLNAKHRPARARTAPLSDHFRPPVFGLEMFRTLRDSIVTLNQHINFSKNSASNMRLFEATGVGGCLLTDWKPNLSSLFEPDSEVLTYRSIDECVEKVNWLLANRDKAAAIGKAGQIRTLRDHTFERRAVRFDALIRERIGNL
jgi:spore maturation protein CgeB